jgi:hypothetical protein
MVAGNLGAEPVDRFVAHHGHNPRQRRAELPVIF